MKLVYMIPFYISENEEELQLARWCFDSLDLSDDVEIVIFNQGYLTNEELQEFMKDYKMKYHIIGVGENVGIPLSRYKCLEYIFNLDYEVDYIAEIHVDMIFQPNWHKPLINYLETSEEPMLSVRTPGFDILPDKFEDKIKFLESFVEDSVGAGGFVHPVIHKAKILKEIEPYDVGFFTGLQGYEDDAILLGYSYYMGRAKKWRPKTMSNSAVAHKGSGQRFKMGVSREEFQKNLQGLFTMYGSIGFKELSRIHDNNEWFYNLYINNIIDKEAYNYDVNKKPKEVDISNIYTSRYFVKKDETTSQCIYDLSKEWISRYYEYKWAMNFVNEGDIVMDAGCGVEYPFKFYLASKCKMVLACDADADLGSWELIKNKIDGTFGINAHNKVLKYLDKITFAQGTIGNIIIDNNSFDKIFCIDILHYMEQEGQQIVLNELYKLLKPNGYLILTILVPYVDINFIDQTVKQIGFSYVESIDKKKPHNTFEFTENKFNVFRMLLTK